METSTIGHAGNACGKALPRSRRHKEAGSRPPPHAATIGNYPSYDSIPAMNTGR